MNYKHQNPRNAIYLKNYHDEQKRKREIPEEKFVGKLKINDMNRVNKLCLLFFFSSLLFKELHATIIIFPSNEDETLRLAGNGTQSKFLAVPNNTSLYSLINKNGTFQEISNIPFDIYIKPSIWNVIQGFYKDQSMKVLLHLNFYKRYIRLTLHYVVQYLAL